MSKEEVSILGALIKNIKNREQDPLSPLIDRYLLERDRSPNRLQQYVIDMKPRRRPPGRLSPSTLAGCKRQAAFTFLGVRGKRKVNPESELRMDRGTWIHHHWQAMFLDMEQVLGPERFKVLKIEEPVKISKLFIRGWLDARVKLNNTDKRVIDVKSINDFGFYKIVADNAPRIEHAKQLMVYMKAKKLEKGIIFYDNKNNSLTKAALISENKVMWVELEAWCEEVIAYLEAGTLPPMHIECEHGNFLYERCHFAKLCYGDKSKSQIKKMMYKDFEGTKESWRKGLLLEDQE